MATLVRTATPDNESAVAISAEADQERFISKDESREIDKFFKTLLKLEGSILHLKVGCPPMVRIARELHPLNRGPINENEMFDLIMPIMDERARQIYKRDGGVDFAYTVEIEGENWRNRVNVLKQMGKMGMVAQIVSNWIPDFKSLYLPESLGDLCRHSQGMILLAGLTGCGKSTTIASMLNWINANYPKHIVTLEDPIEFTFSEKKCLINQREVGIDVKDFMTGMKHAVRQDPDVILVGEMRDRETFETALQAAETGHLVFGTVHASTAASTVGRILDLFPQGMHGAIRAALVMNMKAIVAQKLLPSIKQGVQCVPAVEIMQFNPIIRKLIGDAEDQKLPDAIRIGREDGMVDFTSSLKELVERELIDRPTAMEVAPNRDALRMALKGIESRESGML